MQLCPLVWWVQIFDFWFQPLCLCETQSRRTDDLRMCCSHHEALEEVWWGGGALLVTLSVIYLEFKAHLTSMATRTMTQHTSRLCKGYLVKKESDRVLHQMTWPPQSPNLNPIEMVWDESDCRAKEKCAATHSRLLEKHSSLSWLRECQERAKLSSRQKGGYFEESQI